MNVTIFVTDIGYAAEAKKSGSTIQRVPPKTMISTADQALELNGRLTSYFSHHSLSYTDAPMMNDTEWKQFLDGRANGKPWKRWYGKTSSAIYSVVVYEDSESTPATEVKLPWWDIESDRFFGLSYLLAWPSYISLIICLSHALNLDWNTKERTFSQVITILLVFPGSIFINVGMPHFCLKHIDYNKSPENLQKQKILICSYLIALPILAIVCWL